MSSAEKLMVLKTMLNDESVADTNLTAYLAFAKNEILNWMYNGKIPENVTDVPSRYENTQIMAVIAGLNHAGAEGERVHNENGINRSFSHSDMVDYIRQYVFQVVRIR